MNTTAAPGDNNDLGGLMFLFARFWAHIEIFKREGLSVAIGQDPRGKHLEGFFDCIESTRVRLIDRTEQRAIGETILELQSDKLRTITYIEFIRRTAAPEAMRWLEPLRTTSHGRPGRRRRARRLGLEGHDGAPTRPGIVGAG